MDDTRRFDEKIRSIMEGSPLRGEMPGGAGIPIGGLRPGVVSGRVAGPSNPRYPTRPVNAPVTPRPAPRPGAFTPAQPGYTPGQFARNPTPSAAPRDRLGPQSIRGEGSGPSINYSAALAPGMVAMGGYGAYKTGEALRERRGDEPTPVDADAILRSLPLPEGPTRTPQEMLEPEAPSPDQVLRSLPMPAGPVASPQDVIVRAIAARSPTRPAEPSGRGVPNEPSGSGVPSVAPAKTDLWSRLFGGPQYQGTGGQLLQRSGEGRTTVNWGDPESAANFFRADAAMRKLQADKQDFEGRSGADIDYVNRMAAAQQNAKAVPEGKAGGGSVQDKPTKEAMLHKALEIIHHLIQRG